MLMSCVNLHGNYLNKLTHGHKIMKIPFGVNLKASISFSWANVFTKFDKC